MDCNRVGKLIYQLRKEKNMTQKQIADAMNISDKTVSKWERGQGCPDISLIKELSQVLEVSIEGILTGNININDIEGGNMKKIKFYVCEKCNNIITATGNTEISCCSRKLEPLEAKKIDEDHTINMENIEDEIYITSSHEMEKNHYISFIAYVKGDRILLAKQYPEWNMEFRFHKRGRGTLYFYCVNDGLFYQSI